MSAVLPVVSLKSNPNHKPGGSPDGGQFTTAGSVGFEVAPNPDNVALAARWNRLTQTEKTDISERIAREFVPQVLAAEGVQGTLHEQIGGFEGKTNPSFAIELTGGNEGLVPTASLLGYTLDQKSMMVTSENEFTGSFRNGVVTVDLGRVANFDTVERIYNSLYGLKENGESIVSGHSTENGQMSILNFSGLSNEEFAARIHDRLGKAAASVSIHEVWVAFPGKAEYVENFSTWHPTAGRAPVEGVADRLRAAATAQLEAELTHLGKSATEKFNRWHSPGGTPQGGQFTTSGDENATTNRPDHGRDERPIPEYGKAVPGAISITATHYSKTQTETLSGSFYGSGLHGLEADRLSDPSTDPRLRSRIYFYVDEGNGVRPEDGVGHFKSEVRLNNIYDPTRDGAALWRQGNGDFNRSEKAILDAGFDGYYVRSYANGAGVAVVLGTHSIPVKQLNGKSVVVSLRGNPNHKPAGTPEGGQFASRWSEDGQYTGPKPASGFRGSLPPMNQATFLSQRVQYPTKGPPGINYFKGVIDEKRHVDVLLYRDNEGKVVGILNHFPIDMPPYEKRGNFLVLVSAKNHSQGIGSALVREAGRRWNIDLSAQKYTSSGAALANSLSKPRKSIVVSLKYNHAHDEHGRFATGDGVGPHMTGKELDDAHSPRLAAIAQKVYDKWDESNMDEYAGGGICHLIAEDIASDLSDHHIAAQTVSSNFEQHVYVVAKLKDGVYEVDIPHTLYETGGGFSWSKIPGVEFSAADVVISRIDGNPRNYSQYVEENAANVSFKYNPNHEPGGQPTGGQFAHGPGMSYDKDKKTWVHANGKPVSDEDAARLKAAGTPPGWTDVQLNPDTTAALQVRGKDAAGRTQSRYTKEHTEEADAEKFARLRDFNEVLPDLRAGISQRVADPTLPMGTRDAAAALSVIEQTGIRIGSDKETGAAQKAYGASTLLGEHVTLGEDGRIDLAFPGKSGQVNRATFVDPELHSYLASKNLAPGDRVFATNDAAVRDSMRQITGSEDFTPKDFRTWLGTATAIEEISKRPVPSTKSEYRHLRLDVARVVAARLNNTPAMALKSYIDPTVFASWGPAP